jgi:hypothetical protein
MEIVQSHGISPLVIENLPISSPRHRDSGTVDGTITEMTDDLREARNTAIARFDP